MTTPVFYNTLTRQKEPFEPIDRDNIRMYVCGPTVYDFAHIGNARPVIVFDVLYRLLRHIYGEDKVTYVRNITDVDDKINARAVRDYPDLPLNEAIRKVTEKTATQFHNDVKALGCLEPSFEPRATEHIEGMVVIAQTLLDKGHAYIAEGREGNEVLFRVGSMEKYGQLSNRKLEDQQAGARVAVETHKENAGDFVLWKQSGSDAPGWDASFTVDGQAIEIYGRPGWHIECSAMSKALLGEQFDIHGGGLDLIFPHHENEIAQSCCASSTDKMANIWMHNGYLQVEGKKMSKSTGNFITIHDLLHTTKFGGRKWPGEVLRLAMLMTHYREPIDFSVKRLEEAENIWKKCHKFIGEASLPTAKASIRAPLPEEIIVHLMNDLNTPSAIKEMQKFLSTHGADEDKQKLLTIMARLGILGKAQSYADASPEQWKIQQNQLQIELNEMITAWKNPTDVSDLAIESKVEQRVQLLADKNWAEADRIRDELLAQGIQLKDGKDPETGERVTTWEFVR